VLSQTREDVTFTSGGERIAAWWYPGGTGRRSCVVMAHGFSATKRCGLAPYAERFAAQGHHVLVIDYRHFGDSGGQPRQLLDPRRQVEDLLAATRHARAREDVDPDRVALWGTSFGGGIALVAAVRDGSVAAVVSQCPALDGWTALIRALTQPGQSVGNTLRMLGLVAADLVAAALGREPVMVPSVGPPGSVAVMTAADAEAGFRRIAGPDWQNAVCARVALAVLRYRPVRLADRVPGPWLIQICQRDTVAPISSAERAARRAGSRATVRHYDTGHFAVYVDEDFERSVSDQATFLNQHLGSNEQRG
jgi:pimeloyl-ACP methyl ester carboxylesterase